MATTLAQELHLDAHGRARGMQPDTGARLSRALLSYLALLISALLLMPFEFVVPATLVPDLGFHAVPFLATLAMFAPYGFLTRRARTGRVGQHTLSIALTAGIFSLALETVQLFEPACDASPWHVVAAMIGASCGAVLCARLHDDQRGSANALHAMLLELPLMGLAYLLLPLLWASGATAKDDPRRLVLAVCLAMMGASILGSIARAVRGHTPDRPWWSVPLVATVWSSLGLLPSLLVDWRYTLGGILCAVAYASWRGRMSAYGFVERRYEVPALRAASPFLLLYAVGAAVWPASSFRTYPLVHLWMPSTEAGLALALPLLEMGIAATVLGYVIAEFNSRSESSFSQIGPRIMVQGLLVLVTTEAARSMFGYEGASLLRIVLSLGAVAYGAQLYHLQRAHIQVVARRYNSARAVAER